MENLRNESHAAAVERSIYELDVRMLLAGFRAESQRQQVAQVALIHIRTHSLNLATAQTGLELHHRRIGDLGNLSYNLLVHRAGNLTAVRPADLVTVVLLRVVGSGNHNTGHGTLEAHCVTHLRRRADVVEDIDVDAVG